MTQATRRLWRLILPLVLLVAGAACGSDGDDLRSELGFVGTVDRSDAFVFIIASADEAVAYVCDGDDEVAEWFRGPVADPAGFVLVNDSGAEISAELAEGAYVGVYGDSDGVTHTFTTEEAIGAAGVYRVENDSPDAEGVFAAWIVDNEGNERGAFLRSSRFLPTPRLANTSFTVARAKKTKIGDIRDGTSNTISFIVAPSN